MNAATFVSQPYNAEEFSDFVYDFLPAFEEDREEKVPQEKTVFTEINRLGKDKELDLAVYEFHHGRKDPRVTLTRDAFRVLKNYESYCEGALAVFVNDESKEYRFSLITSGLEKDPKTGRIKTAWSNPRRFSFILGGGITRNTPARRLEGEVQNIEELKERFSVEALTEQFYQELFDWYSWATATAKFWASDQDTIETKVIRMITRIMFVWFIKQKNFVPENLFDPKHISSILKNFDPQSEKSGNYYNAILQNLFFATLNCAVGERRFAPESDANMDIKTLYRYQEMFSISPDEALKLFYKIPFLNGGLFECLDRTKTLNGVDHAYYYDGFSRNPGIRAFVPNILFFEPERGLIPILKRYNFTVEENLHNDIQVALDPELLGKVFENLLAAYNPETEETVRKQTGSFYTPREIVSYMADQSLINFLGDTPEVRKLFLDFDLDDNDRLSLQPIAKKLEQIKILDPACGSGAFPVCLLTRITELLLLISPDKNPYDLKLSIIKNCLYGSDIQCIATQITKLRFFISLICNQGDMDSSKPELNFGVSPLPNLETKFVAANSLIKIRRLGDLLDNNIDPLKERLREVRNKHFTARSRDEKKKLRKEDEDLRKELEKALLHGVGYLASKADAEGLARWNPYDQNGVAPFFEPEWMFGISEGFDIVIGNPPYIRLKKIEENLKSLYKKEDYRTYHSNGDIYCLFYERGQQLLKPGGHLCFITSNKWMRADYGEGLRGLFLRETNPKLLIDFPGVKVFKSASVDTNILLFSKSNYGGETRCAVATRRNASLAKNLDDFMEQKGRIYNFSKFDSGIWVVLSDIEKSIKQKIDAAGVTLKNWGIKPNRGILTGRNDVFHIVTAKRDEILANCESDEERKKTEELIRPVVKGVDIKRQGYKWKNLWLIYIPWHFPYQFDKSITGASKKAEMAFEKQYPALYAYLLEHKDSLMKRNQNETGIRYEWYALQRWGSNYWKDFSKPKVIYPETTQGAYFVYDEDSMFIDKTCFMLVWSDTTELKYLQATLRSRLFEFAYKRIYSSIGLGDQGYQYNEHALLKLPVIKTYKPQATYSDSYFYKLYGLSQEEIDFVESQYSNEPEQ